MTDRPRIAVCGIHIECSTFSPHFSTTEDFEVRQGDAVLERYPFLQPGGELADAADYVGVLHARAMPGGAVVAETYADFKCRILDGLAATGDLDGVLYDIHGAMSVVGMDDPEGDLVTAIRAVVGPGAVISAPMDLHGNVSVALFDGCDLLTCYRTAPHVDVVSTRQRALRQLIDALRTGVRPHRALVHVPILLPGEMTSTRVDPAAGLYAQIPRIEALPGVIDASIWIGFAWSDEPRNQAAVVVTGTDSGVVEREALALARAVWEARRDFTFVAPTDDFAGCLAAALSSGARPFFISDSGDNPGAGGADDCTFTLATLLAEPRIRSNDVSCVLASLVDPHAVAQALDVGVGNEAIFTVGGRIDTREPGPRTFSARVAATTTDTSGRQAVRLVNGGLHVIVTSRRDQYATLAQYRRLGIDPGELDIVVVKIGYLEPELSEIQRAWVLALTPGGVDQDLRRLGHRRVHRPMFPLDDEASGRPETALVR